MESVTKEEIEFCKDLKTRITRYINDIAHKIDEETEFKTFKDTELLSKTMLKIIKELKDVG